MNSHNSWGISNALISVGVPLKQNSSCVGLIDLGVEPCWCPSATELQVAQLPRLTAAPTLLSDLVRSAGKSDLRPRFTPGERTSRTHWTGGWVGPRAGLDSDVKRKIPLASAGDRTLKIQLNADPSRAFVLVSLYRTRVTSSLHFEAACRFSFCDSDCTGLWLLCESPTAASPSMSCPPFLFFSFV
jgi:hypothetical protein